jgi:hypothetical protein
LGPVDFPTKSPVRACEIGHAANKFLSVISVSHPSPNVRRRMVFSTHEMLELACYTRAVESNCRPRKTQPQLARQLQKLRQRIEAAH